MSMSRKLIFSLLLILGTGSLIFPVESQAMPMFARKYSVDCSMCHYPVPKLNKYGYEFRAAGYRIPSDIGKSEEAFKLGNFFAARLQEEYKVKNHDDVKPANDYTSSQLEFHELTLYPLTGSWGKYFGSLGEFSMAPDDVFEVENAYIRGVYGDENGWFQGRAGIMHAWEGFGASDRPIGNTRPLFQKGTAIGSPFVLWSEDEAAVEVGYNLARTGTSVAGRISNGIIWKEDGSGKAEPAQGGALTKTKNRPAWNDKNFQIFANQFITDNSAVSVYYYYGVVPFPDPNYAFTTTTTRDRFHRFAIYANYWPVADKLNLLTGYSYGYDDLENKTIKSTDGKYDGTKVGNSQGAFGEVDFHVSPQFAIGGRYDFYDPARRVNNNNQNAFTLMANYYISHGLQVIADYQHKDTDLVSGGSNKDDTFLARLIFIW